MILNRMSHGAARTGLNTLYLLLAFPLGIAYFVFLVSGIALGFGLLITIVGLPVLLLMTVLWWQLARFERLITTSFLNANIAASPALVSAHGSIPGEQPTKRGGLNVRANQLWSHLKNPLTWKSLLYLFAKFPFGLLSFVTITVFLSLSGVLLSAPITYRYSLELMQNGDQSYRIDTFFEGMLAFAAGLVMLVASVAIINGLAYLWRQFAELLLSSRRASARADAGPLDPTATLSLAS